jgi:hypothetical protein
MRLDVDRCDVAEDAALRVCLADFHDFDINRQTLDFGDRLAH